MNYEYISELPDLKVQNKSYFVMSVFLLIFVGYISLKLKFKYRL